MTGPKTDQPVRRARVSTAAVAIGALPGAFGPGERTAIKTRTGWVMRMPPLTPDLPGSLTWASSWMLVVASPRDGANAAAAASASRLGAMSVTGSS